VTSILAGFFCAYALYRAVLYTLRRWARS